MTESEREILDQYKESTERLGILYFKLRESLRVFSSTFNGLQTEKEISPECIEYADSFSALVQEYRETHERCTDLHSALSSWASVISDIPHPKL